MNNETILEIHAVLCEITNKETTRYGGLYKILEIVKRAEQQE